jgi:hypothetical protein
LTSGALTTNGNITIDLTTGAVSGTGSGNISGNLKTKKYIAVPKHGYHYISTPVGGATIAQLTDNVYIGPSIMFYYDETKVSNDSMAGWTDIGNYTTYALPQLKGHALFCYSGYYPLDIIGSYNHAASFSSTLTHTNALANVGGWNLVGNPYPSTLDWDAVSGWTKTNLDNAVYYWDIVNERYAIYAAGSGINGGTRYIPSMQSFFVHVTSQGTGTIGMNNNVRTTSSNPSVWKLGNTNMKELKLTASTGKYSDETIIKFRDDATNSFDSQMDAHKLLNSSACPDIYTSIEGIEYAINNLNTELKEITLPLKLNAGTSGIHQLLASGLESFDVTDNILLEDKLLNQIQDLKQNPQYSFSLSTGDTTTRFYLHFKNTQTNIVNGITPSQTEAVTIYPKGDYISVNFNNPSSSNANITIYTLDGELVSEFKNINTNSENYLPMYGNTNSLYLVKVVLKDKVFAQKINYFR